MESTLTRRIIALLPSEALKRAIERSGYVFSKNDLLSIASQFAPCQYLVNTWDGSGNWQGKEKLAHKT